MIKKEEIELLYTMLISGEGYDTTVEEYVDGCDDIEAARIEAEQEIANGKIWFGATCGWYQYDISTIEYIESLINSGLGETEVVAKMVST
jgi:hypothetical protein